MRDQADTRGRRGRGVDAPPADTGINELRPATRPDLLTGYHMARNARPTAAKRNREKNLIEKRQQKESRRRDFKDQKTDAPRIAGVDSDIANIVPGPQPLADWQLEAKAEEEAAEQDEEGQA